MLELDKVCVPELRDGVKKRGGVLFWLMSIVFSNESLRVLSAMGTGPVFTGSLRTYLVRLLPASASLAGRALACKPVPFRQRSVYSPKSLLHRCRTSVLSAIRSPCHRPNESGSKNE